MRVWLLHERLSKKQNGSETNALINRYEHSPLNFPRKNKEHCIFSIEYRRLIGTGWQKQAMTQKMTKPRKLRNKCIAPGNYSILFLRRSTTKIVLWSRRAVSAHISWPILPIQTLSLAELHCNFRCSFLKNSRCQI